MQFYKMPDLPDLPGAGRVPNLVPDNQAGNKLEPETPVLCINRGQRPIHDKWDGRDYTLPVGFFQARYDQAQHFRARAVVPGTRNPETGKQVSFVGIVGVDRDEACAPFTADELLKFDRTIEAIDREALTDYRARTVQVITTAAARARMPGAGASLGGLKPQVSVEAGDPNSARAEAAAAAIMTPEARNEAQREMAADLASARTEAPDLYREAMGGAGEDPAAPSSTRRGRRG